MKKTIIPLFFVLFIPVLVSAKSSINAGDIIKEIDSGAAVHYEDVEIVGDLDFTSVKDVTRDSKFDKDKESFTCHVKSRLEFKNCIFKGDVIAYFNNEREETLYNAEFQKDVVFEACVFTGNCTFKYSKFFEKANFKDSQFHEESNFKYTKFSDEINFENTEFEREANFKYTKFSTEVSFKGAKFHKEATFKYTDFPEYVNFAETHFRRDAIFKYTKFPKGVNFGKAVFSKDVDFKHTKFSEPTNFDDTIFDGDVDFKYTKIDGKPFSLYLLKHKR